MGGASQDYLVAVVAISRGGGPESVKQSLALVRVWSAQYKARKPA